MALDVDHSELVSAYEGPTGQTWVLTSPELEALVERAVETGVRRAPAEHDYTEHG